MSVFKQMLLGVGVPGAISLIVLWFTWKSSAVEFDRRRRVWAGALAFGAAYFAGWFFTLGMPAYPPEEAVEWLPWFALCALLIGLIDGAGRPLYMFLWVIRLSAAGAAMWLILLPLIRSSWTSDMGFYWVLWLTVGVIAIWSAIDETSWRLKGWQFPLALAISTLALSLSMLWSGSALYFQVGLILAAALGGAFLVAIGRPIMTLAGGAVPVFMLVYYGLLVCGYFFTDLPEVNPEAFDWQQLVAPLLAIAPALGVLALGGRLHRNPVKQATVAFFWVVIPAAFAAGIAFYLNSNTASY